MTVSQKALAIAQSWWDSLVPLKQNNNLPSKGTVAGALVVLERLKEKYTLDINEHRATRGQSQIKGVSKANVQKILSRFGETRNFVKEGGRTNRGLAGDIVSLLKKLQQARLESLTTDVRIQILTEVQEYLVLKVGEYFNRERVKFIYNPEHTAWQSIHAILESAREVGKEGPVAQYLVGAKLALRFPDIDVRNDMSSTQDELSGIPGDFLIGDGVFHVTVAPNLGHFEKCKQNIDMGFSVYLLVPQRRLAGTKDIAEDSLPGRVTTQSIESFVAQNLEELSMFSKDKLRAGFRLLLEKYNERVDTIEPDKSLLIEIPRNL
jgi:hypothetical protein